MMAAGSEWIMWLLIGLSVASVAVIVERVLALRALGSDLSVMRRDLVKALREGGFDPKSCSPKSCSPYGLNPVVDPGSVEPALSSHIGATDAPLETLWASYYSSDGLFDKDSRVVHDPISGRAATWDGVWRPKATAGKEVHLFAVVRDNRAAWPGSRRTSGSSSLGPPRLPNASPGSWRALSPIQKSAWRPSPAISGASNGRGMSLYTSSRGGESCPERGRGAPSSTR